MRPRHQCSQPLDEDQGFIGVGFRDFAVAPAHAATVLETVRQVTGEECRRVAELVLQAPRAMDVQRVLLNHAPVLDRQAIGRPAATTVGGDGGDAD